MTLSRALTFLSFLFLSSQAARAEAPPWVRLPTRSVDAGYLVYIGVSQDGNFDSARTLAEGAALEDLANECTFVPIGAHVEDHYEDGAGAYAKVGVQFSDCEEAQNAITADEIRKVSNPALMESLRRYHAIVDFPVLSDPKAPPPPVRRPVVTHAWGFPPPPTWGHAVTVGTMWDYYVWRQKVYYAKTAVIYSTPPAYAPGSLQASTLTRNLTNVNLHVRRYEQKNPTLQTTAVGWSTAQSRFAGNAPQRPLKSASVPFHPTNTHPQRATAKAKHHKNSKQASKHVNRKPASSHKKIPHPPKKES
jgi:hypothetical protein